MQKKSLVKNSIYNVVYRLLNMLFPLATSVYVSHILMASGIGKVSYAQNIVQYFVILAPLGITNYGTREIAKNRLNHELTNHIFSELFLINICSTAICSIIYYSAVTYMDMFADERLLFYVAGLPIIFNAINIEWYYYGNEEYGYIALRSFIVKLISLILLFVFVKTADDYIIYALIYTLGIAGNYIFNITNLHRKNVKIVFKNLSLSRHFKPTFIFLCTTISIELYTLLDTTMLGFLCTDEVVGYYTNSIKLVKILVALITSVGSVLLPRLSFYKNQGKLDECCNIVNKVVAVMLFLSIPCGIGTFILSDKLILVLFGNTFLPANTTVKIATGLIYVLGFSNLFGTQILLTFNAEKKLLISTIVGAVTNICMNLILIPQYNHNGAVVASVLSECLVTLITFLFAKKFIKVRINKSFAVKTAVSVILMGISVLYVSGMIENNILNIFVSVFIGCVVYFVSNALLKNPVLIEAKGFFKSRKKHHV